MKDAVTDRLQLYESGEITRTELFGHWLELCADAAVEQLLVAVPDEWRPELMAWLREMYDNDVPPHEFVWVHSAGAARSYGQQVVTKVREWFARADSATGADRST